MGKETLVGVDIEAGKAILAILDTAELKIRVAMWAQLSDYEDARLVLSSREFDRVGLIQAYHILHEALDAAGFPPEKSDLIMILSMSSPFIKPLRRIFGKAKSVEGMRLGLQTIGDRFVDDAYVYRIK